MFPRRAQLAPLATRGRSPSAEFHFARAKATDEPADDKHCVTEKAVAERGFRMPDAVTDFN